MALLALLAVTAHETAFAQKKIIRTDAAPVPIAPYSQGIMANGFLFVAGQVGLDPATRKLVPGGVETETIRAMENVKAVLAAAGLDFSHVVNTTIYLTDINSFAKVNELYGRYFTRDFPARATVGVAALPGGAVVEVAVVAVTK